MDSIETVGKILELYINHFNKKTLPLLIKICANIIKDESVDVDKRMEALNLLKRLIELKQKS